MVKLVLNVLLTFEAKCIETSYITYFKTGRSSLQTLVYDS